jgi:hypothetical protein
MSRHTGFIRPMIAVCAISVLGPLTSFADDIPLPLKDFLQRPQALGYSRVEILFQNFAATVVIEYLVICTFLGWPARALPGILFWVLVINVITNPVSQVTAIHFGKAMTSEEAAWAMVCLIELLIVIVEFSFLWAILARMYSQGALDEVVTPERTLLTVVAANLASFLFGFVGFIFLLIDHGLDKLVIQGLRQ